MVDYWHGITRPFHEWKIFLLGSLFFMFPILNFFSIGYILTSAEHRLRQKEHPAWDRWGYFFIHGFFATLITLIYLLPATICFFFSLRYLTLPNLIDVVVDLQIDLLFSPALFLGLVFLLLALYLIPYALIRSTDTQSFLAAFHIGAILRGVLQQHYFLSWIITLIYGGIIFGILILSSLLIFLSVPDIRFLFLVPFITGIILWMLTMTGFTILCDAYRKQSF